MGGLKISGTTVNIGTGIDDFFVAKCLLYNQKLLDTRMLLGSGIYAASERAN